MTEVVCFVAQRALTPSTSWRRRLGWLILIWSASIVALAIVAALFRALMNAAGLTT
jgi:hypothetical protein